MTIKPTPLPQTNLAQLLQSSTNLANDPSLSRFMSLKSYAHMCFSVGILTVVSIDSPVNYIKYEKSVIDALC